VRPSTCAACWRRRWQSRRSARYRPHGDGRRRYHDFPKPSNLKRRPSTSSRSISRSKGLERRDRTPARAWTPGLYNGHGLPRPANSRARGRAIDSSVHFTNALPQATTVHWHGSPTFPSRWMACPARRSGKSRPGGTFHLRTSPESPTGHCSGYHPHVGCRRRRCGFGLYGALLVSRIRPSASDVAVADEHSARPEATSCVDSPARSRLAHERRNSRPAMGIGREGQLRPRQGTRSSHDHGAGPAVPAGAGGSVNAAKSLVFLSLAPRRPDPLHRSAATDGDCRSESKECSTRTVLGAGGTGQHGQLHRDAADGRTGPRTGAPSGAASSIRGYWEGVEYRHSRRELLTMVHGRRIGRLLSARSGPAREHAPYEPMAPDPARPPGVHITFTAGAGRACS
jgi:hypothetical protein